MIVLAQRGQVIKLRSCKLHQGQTYSFRSIEKCSCLYAKFGYLYIYIYLYTKFWYTIWAMFPHIHPARSTSTTCPEYFLYTHTQRVRNPLHFHTVVEYQVWTCLHLRMATFRLWSRVCCLKNCSRKPSNILLPWLMHSALSIHGLTHCTLYKEIGKIVWHNLRRWQG